MKGKSSPWGKIQDSQPMGEGVVFVSTAGHGGLKLDRVRNARIPALFRQKGGWYEEDCAIYIPFFFIPECRPNTVTAEYARSQLVEWFKEDPALIV